MKLDYTVSPKDSFWFRFQINNGSTLTPDPISPIFNSVSSAPVRSGAVGWTHVFGPTLVNQFNPGITYNKKTSDFDDPSKAHSLLPIIYIVAPFSIFGCSLFGLPFKN